MQRGAINAGSDRRRPVDMRPQEIVAGVWLSAFAMAVSVLSVDAQTVQGRVLDAQQRRPVAHAVVRLTDPSGESLTAVAADSTGRYQLPLPGPGRYRVRVEHLGYQTQDSAPFDAQNESDTVSVDVRLEPRPVPLRGLAVTADQVDRRLRQFLGMSPAQLRIRPILARTINDHVSRGNGIPQMMSMMQIPNLQVLRTREGLCYQFRGRGCIPVYFDGTRLIRGSTDHLGLEMVSAIVVLLPAEAVQYPEGAIHLFTVGYLR